MSFDRTLRRLEDALDQRVPFAQFQYVDVTFNAVANADTIISHLLTPVRPEDVDYEVCGWSFASAPATAPVIYTDTSGSRKAWGKNYLVLRCNVASAVACLRLSIRAVDQT